MLALLLLTACAETDRGSLTGDFLKLRDCVPDGDVIFDAHSSHKNPYEMRADFFALQQLGEISFIRMQTGGKPLHRTDALVMEVTDTFIANRIGFPVEIDHANVRVSLHVLGTCPGNAQSMTAHEGTITFQAFGSEKGDRVKAFFDFQLFDDRTGEVLGLGFKGSFDFIVKVGQPYQPFAGQQL